MLSGLLVFLVGCLVLAVILYVAKMILDILSLPAPVNQIALLILGLIGLLVLIMLALRAFGGGIPLGL